MHSPRKDARNAAATPARLVARNVAAVAQIEAAELARRTAAERFSDAVAGLAGTAAFAALHVAWFAGWIVWNTGLVPHWKPIDPYPFSFLTLIVSLEAIFLSIFVLISQNNLTRQSERRANLDLQINLLAEQESTKTVALLERIARHLRVPAPAGTDGRELAAPTDINDVVSTLDSALSADVARAVPTAHEGSIGNDPGHDTPRNAKRAAARPRSEHVARRG